MAPTAEAGDAIRVKTGEQFILNGEASTDPESLALEYTWTRLSGSGLATIVPTNPDKSIANRTLRADSLNAGADDVTHTYQLEVKDAGNLKDTDTVVVTVYSENAPPIAHAGDNQEVDSGSLVELNGSQSRDIDGTLRYAWRRTGGSGDNTVTLSDPTAIYPTFTAETLTAGSGDKTHIFTLRVTDDENATNEASVTITVKAPPRVNIPPTVVVPADFAVQSGGTIELDGSRSSDEHDPQSALTFNWVKTNEGTSTASLARIPTSDTKIYRAIAETLLWPNTAVTHVFQLTVTDTDLGSSSDKVTVTVNPAPRLANTPPIANAGTNQNVASGSIVTNRRFRY